MATTTLKISQWLEKMDSIDKDFRFMAVNDILAVLKQSKLDSSYEVQVAQKLLKLLHDKNGEIQNLSMQCFIPLAEHSEQTTQAMILKHLCNDLLAGDDRGKEVSALTLKALAKDPPKAEQAFTFQLQTLTSGICYVLRSSDTINTQLALDCMEILQNQLHIVISIRAVIHSSFDRMVMDATLPLLFGNRSPVRKRAIAVLSYLLVLCGGDVKDEVMTAVVGCLTQAIAAKDMANIKAMLQCVASLNSHAGHRLASGLPVMMELLFSFSDEEDVEIVEYILQTFEAMIRRCPQEITAYVPDIITRCVRALSYDPNYNYGSADDDDDEPMDDDVDDEEEDDEDADYSDDDDVSWKVRRQAARCLSSLISSRPDMSAEFYKQISPVLISRFKEREENVKVDILSAYQTLLSVTRPMASNGVSLGNGDASASSLQEQSADLVKAVHSQLRDKSSRVRQECFSLLSKLVLILPGVLSSFISVLVPAIHSSLVETKQLAGGIKTDALSFLRALLQTHQANAFQGNLSSLIPPLVAAIDDNFYKIISEALLVVQAIVRVLRPLEPTPVAVDAGTVDEIVNPLFESMLKRLVATDIDQEVKENTLLAMGCLIHHFADCIGDKLASCLNIFMQRLENEVTRIAAVKAIAVISDSPLQPPMPDVPAILSLMASFLRKQHRLLVLATLTSAASLITAYSSQCPTDMLTNLMSNCFTAVNAADLHISQLALSLMTRIVKIRPKVVSTMSQTNYTALVAFPQSPLVQGAVLHVYVEFLRAVPPQTAALILSAMQSLIMTSDRKSGLLMHRQCYQSFALATSALVSMDAKVTDSSAKQLLSAIQNPATSDSSLYYALLALGSIGKSNDLKSVDIDAITKCFAGSEDVKAAASTCLGLVSAGNSTYFVPYILEQIGKKSKHQYLLLHTLRECISCLSATPEGRSQLLPFVDNIWSILFVHCESSEEGTRNMVAECLGKLTLLSPENRLPILRETLSSESSTALSRATVISAVRFTISDQSQTVEVLLQDMIGDFLDPIRDTDLNVRRVTLLLFNSVAHNKPSLILNRLPTLLPLLYKETDIQKHLIREVEMGPFKHTVDDGLDNRKAAFECMYTLLESCLERLDIFEFLANVAKGMSDHYDIKMLTYLMVIRLANLAPTALLNRMADLKDALKAVLLSKPKANAVKQELEKQDELKRSAVRCCSALFAIHDWNKCSGVMELYETLSSHADLKAMSQTVREKSSTTGMVTGTVPVSKPNPIRAGTMSAPRR